MSAHISFTRYAIDNGKPVYETVEWMYHPDDERSVATTFHDALGMTVIILNAEGEEEAVPAPNAWFFLSWISDAGQPFGVVPVGTPHPEGGTIHPVGSPYWSWYDLPLREGVAIVTEAEYETAVTQYAADVAAAGVVVNAAGLLDIQGAWDAKSVLLSGDGLGPSSIMALLGPRPT